MPPADPAVQTQLAVQLYTLRDHTQTAKDLARTCARLAEDGWRAVQVSAIGPLRPTEVRRILDDHGLICCATHRGPELWEDPQRVIDDHAVLDCRYTAFGGFFPKPEEWSEGSWRAWIDRFNRAAEAYAASPVRIGYHNHSHELAKLGGQLDLRSQRPWDLLLAHLVEHVWFEPDTYWLAHGGLEPATTIRSLGGRVPVVHLKDLAILPDRTIYMAEVGVGNLDWQNILGACREAGVEWYVVEQDTCYRDPFDSLRTSLENLRAMGLR